MKRAAALFGIALALGIGCVTPTEPVTEETGDSLAFIERSDEAVIGTIEVDGLTASFESRQIAEQVFAIEVLYNGITLTADIDYPGGSAKYDGFASEDGSDTVLTDDDKVLIAELGQALADEGLAKTTRDPEKRKVVYFSPGATLVHALSVWHLTPVSSELRRDMQMEAGRTITYLCGWLTGYGKKASHDCWDCWDYWDGWNYVNIGPEGAYNCYPDSCSSSCSNYNTYRCGRLSCEQSGGGGNGTWQWGSNSDKYGACTVWDTNAYTQDCLYHDHCVRNDHSTGSGWCSDDAVPAGDDQTGARDCIMKNGCSGNCGGYNSAAGCWCDSSCDSAGDCCMDKHQKCG